MNIEIFDPRLLEMRSWQNERGIELALGKHFIENHDNVIEVGATMPTYYQINHEVIDPYDPYEKSIRQDAELYDFTGRNVLSISTIEHMGRQDYSTETEIDPQKPIRFLHKIFREAKHFLITWPIAANKDLDCYVKDNSWSFRGKFAIYQRIFYNPPLWQISSDLSLFDSVEYNKPWPNGNAIMVLSK